MTIFELARLVADMRRAQKQYFRSRTQGDLEASKRLERVIDGEVDLVLRQPTLFDMEPSREG